MLKLLLARGSVALGRDLSAWTLWVSTEKLPLQRLLTPRRPKELAARGHDIRTLA